MTAGTRDIPRLFNYDAKRFDIRDVMGDLSVEEVELSREGEGEEIKVDKEGRKVNKHGYLVDK